MLLSMNEAYLTDIMIKEKTASILEANPNIFDIYKMDFMGILERVESFRIIATNYD